MKESNAVGCLAVKDEIVDYGDTVLLALALPVLQDKSIKAPDTLAVKMVPDLTVIS